MLEQVLSGSVREAVAQERALLQDVRAFAVAYDARGDYAGRIDELLLLGRALSDDEVRALHAAGNPYR